MFNCSDRQAAEILLRSQWGPSARAIFKNTAASSSDEQLVGSQSGQHCKTSTRANGELELVLRDWHPIVY
eukprot:6070903-Amphidinium_carterae.4